MITIEGFEEYFRTLWNCDPFSWQTALAKRVALGNGHAWPEAIGLPTAAGKTACLDIAVYALSLQANHLDRGIPLTAARRIFFVVDRRIIVDEAFERARKLARKLNEANRGILKDVADALRKIAGGPIPLECYELRGGMYRSDAWARDPLQPAIIASTVDQVGSRILFRAYGRSHKAWPIQAGLAANDSLILLDEAHCAVPFMETMHSISKYRQWAEAPLPTPFYPVVMSATPPPGMKDIFSDKSSEPQNPLHPLGRRQLVSKPARLETAKEAKGKNAETKLAEALAKEAQALAARKNIAVVVFSNRVRTARNTFKILKKNRSNDVVLLTGRMRPFDKDDTVKQKLAPLSSDHSDGRTLKRPLLVVATQTLEVGADLDFDALVTECASLDALRQRFGRLNRMGRPIESRACILIRADQEANSDDDPVYGPSISETWKWMKAQINDEGTIDFSILSIKDKLSNGADAAKLNAPSSHAPVMLPAHLDCLAQTAPEPLPSPEVALFLHGPDRASADIHACWRADLELHDADSLAKSIDVLSLHPPATAECLPVPIWVMRNWIAGDDNLGAGSDIEGESPPSHMAEEDKSAEGKNRRCLRWRGREDVLAITDASDIRPGDIVVIPSETEGWDSLGDLALHGEHGPVLDFGDRAYAQTRGKALFRLHPKVIAEWPAVESKVLFSNIASEAHTRWEEDPDGLAEEVHDALLALGADATAPEWLRISAEHLARDPSFLHYMKPHPLGGLILRSGRRLPNPSEGLDLFSDEDDASASGTAEVPLAEHLAGVEQKVRIFASGCTMPEPIQNAVARAAGLHDTGKADSRFQSLLRGGLPWISGADTLAKSAHLPQSYSAYEKARRNSGFPPGGRHELISVRLAESDRATLPDDKDLSDLVLHLIASHHGHCRPFAPVVTDAHPVQIHLSINGYELEANSDTGLERIDSGVAERFWRLTRHYGWWGLAWLEAVLRLADHRESELEEQQKGGN